MALILNMRQLIKKRGEIKGNLTRFVKFVEKCNQNTIDEFFIQLESRLDNAYLLLDQFNTFQSEIECFDERNLQVNEELESGEASERERLEFEDKYYNALAGAKKLIKLHLKDNQPPPLGATSTSSSSGQVVTSSNVRFPVIELPKFYGDYEKWGQFRDMFISLVHNDNALDDIKKFYYLLSCVKGDAAKIIENIEVTELNYPIALNLLKSRYENKYVIIKNHIAALVESPPVNSKDLYTSLRILTDGLQKHVRALTSLGEPVDTWDTILFYIIGKKLDYVTQREWESLLISSSTSNRKVCLKDLIDFLERRCILLETLSKEKHVHNVYSRNDRNTPNKRRDNGFSGIVCDDKTLCLYCKLSKHEIYQCEKLKILPVQSRYIEIKKLKLCTNCLSGGHSTFECKAHKCRKCNKHHNTFLHFDERPKTPFNTSNTGSSSQENLVNHSNDNLVNTATSNCCKNPDPQVILSTAIVNIADSDGKWHQCRVLLDSGSQPNFMSRKLCDKLRLSCSRVHIPVIGIGHSSTDINQKVTTSIKSLFENFELKLSFLILNHITNKLPSASFDHNLLNLPQNITLSDPEFNISREIDLLLGASVFFDLIRSKQIKLGTGLPVLQESRLGWIIAGNIHFKMTNVSSNLTCNFSIHNSQGKSLQDSIEQFWRIEDIPLQNHYTSEEQQCEELFVRTTKRSEKGNFIVTLPTRDNVNNLDTNLENALKRFNIIENKFKKNNEIHKLYTNFMNEYLSLGHMIKIDSDKINQTLSNCNKIYYLPHHCILNEQLNKFRVVFDGSSKSNTGISLNDTLKVGPTIQDNLLNILLRFRGHSIVIVADVEKMYRMIFIDENQRDLQRIVWRDNPNSEIEHYQLLTITYGTSSAAFQAIRSLQQVGIENYDEFPDICDIILHDFYVDDLVTGTSNINDALRLKNSLSDLLLKYGFKLRKWASNDPEIVDQNELSPNYHISDNEIRKTLGLIWQSNHDILSYSVSNSELKTKPTKRSIFSLISKIFDPLGLLSPVTIKAKIMMQKLWELKLDWDSLLSGSLLASWNNFITQLVSLNDIQVPRHVVLSDAKYIEIHGFCDASQQAYAACIYVRSINKDDKIEIHLLCSKTRVAPLKTITLPRLELCGALLLAQLYQNVVDAVKFAYHDVFFWTDSSIVLSWLAAPPSTWKIFVANRVSEIQRLTDGLKWRHVPTATNPADIASRGTDPSNLANHSLWWYGPEWLLQNSDLWPQNITHQYDDDSEKRSSQLSLGVMIPDYDIFKRYSNLYKLKRITAFCIRFINNISKNKPKLTGELTIQETDHSMIVLVRIAQLQSFSSEICCLRKKNSVPRDSRLKNLDPFLDSCGLLRVGGRLAKSNLPFENKHQIILYPKHPLTTLIILNDHHRQLHVGAQTLLASLREQFWLLNGRATVRSILRRCITCFRINPQGIVRKMSELPADRITQNRPFLIVGTDLAGPFNIKDGKLRNRSILKAYLCVFICFTTKAVHLEVISDLTTKSFLNCLKRFISRRGLCKRIYSDNGTNFVGASNELKRVYASLETFLKDRAITDFFLQNSIEWRFIPPHSPHRGGLWEASVKRAKYHATRIIGKLTLTFEDLATVFTQIEAIMNSRPLTPLSQDPNDLTALTPGHFLIGHSLTSIPQPDLKDIPNNRLEQFQILQQAVQDFWTRWSREYLQTLQQRVKWYQNSSDLLQEGNLVLLIDENTPPLYWKMGRVIGLHDGGDSVKRTATIRTASGITSRALQKLCVLPVGN